RIKLCHIIESQAGESAGGAVFTCTAVNSDFVAAVPYFKRNIILIIFCWRMPENYVLSFGILSSGISLVHTANSI
ncbi:MAG: hypothetical protein PUE13_08890, partial [Clostridiales bacterium]|nr:hypothetical protein [Clostridiales bacterium]